MPKKRNALLVLIAAILCTTAHATKIRYDVTFEETFAHSDLVVVGTVGKKLGTVWRGTKHRRVYTRYEFKPTDVLSGELPQSTSLVLLTEGGTYWHEKLQTELEAEAVGAIQVNEGEHLLACLRRVQENEYQFVGLAHGKYVIQENDEGLPVLTIRTKRTDLLQGSTTELTQTSHKKPSTQKLSLPALAEFIQSLKQPPDEPESQTRPAGR